MLEQNWNINIPVLVRNSITVLVNTIKRRYSKDVQSQMQQTIATLKSILRASMQGSYKATRLILKEARSKWQLEETPRSFHKTLTDDLIHILPPDAWKPSQHKAEPITSKTKDKHPNISAQVIDKKDGEQHKKGAATTHTS